MRFQNKVCLVTGGGSGIGRAVCEQRAREGGRMNREYDSSKVRINAVAPGAVDTPMLWSNPNVKSGREKIEGQIGKPEDLASAICYLAADEARYINGTTLVVDGGRLDIL